MSDKNQSAEEEKRESKLDVGLKEDAKKKKSVVSYDSTIFSAKEKEKNQSAVIVPKDPKEKEKDKDPKERVKDIKEKENKDSKEKEKEKEKRDGSNIAKEKPKEKSAEKDKDQEKKDSTSTTAPALVVPLSIATLPLTPSVTPLEENIPTTAKFTKSNMRDYAHTKKRFSLYCPSTYNFAYDVMDKWAEREPNRRALISIPEDFTSDALELSFGQIRSASDRAAFAFHKLGLKKGDRVLVLLPSAPEWYACVLGMMKLGVVVCPVTHTSTPFEVSYRLQQLDASAIITSFAHAECIEAAEKSVIRVLKIKVLIGAEPRAGWTNYQSLIDEVESDAAAARFLATIPRTKSTDVMFICFVSVTSGHPRMIYHTFSYALAQYAVAYFVHDLKVDDIHWTVSDYGWSRAFWGKFFGPWLIGSSVVQFPQPVRNAARYLKVLSKYRVTVFCATPTLYRKILLENVSRYDLSCLRHCLSVGEALHPAIIHQWRSATGLTIYNHYSQTETGCLLANFRCTKAKDGSMGLPLPGLEVLVVDRDGREVKDMAEGTVVVRVAPRRPLGVFMFDFLDRRLTPTLIKHGFYYTQDRAYRDVDGYFWFIARRDDVFKSAGFRVGPGEIEYALAQHPQVVEAAVVGVPDPTKGLAIKAYVVLVTTFIPTEKFGQELKDHVRTLLAAHLVPRYIEFVSQLPKTLNGQVRRSQLRALELNKAQKQFAKL